MSHQPASFSRGLLYRILSNPVYIGKISHKGTVYEGQHAGIVSSELWDSVQTRLSANAARARGVRSEGSADSLKGRLFDREGNAYTPTYTVKGGRRYRYYVNQALLQGRGQPRGIVARLPAHEVEALIRAELGLVFRPERMAPILGLCPELNAEELHLIAGMPVRGEVPESLLRRVEVGDRALRLVMDLGTLRARIQKCCQIEVPSDAPEHVVILPVTTGRAKTGTVVLEPDGYVRDKSDPFDRPAHELKAWVRGVIWREAYAAGSSLEQIAASEGITPRYVSALILKSFENG